MGYEVGFTTASSLFPKYATFAEHIRVHISRNEGKGVGNFDTVQTIDVLRMSLADFLMEHKQVPSLEHLSRSEYTYPSLQTLIQYAASPQWESMLHNAKKLSKKVKGLEDDIRNTFLKMIDKAEDLDKRKAHR